MGVPHITCYRVDRLDTYNRIKLSITTKIFYYYYLILLLMVLFHSNFFIITTGCIKQRLFSDTVFFKVCIICKNYSFFTQKNPRF